MSLLVFIRFPHYFQERSEYFGCFIASMLYEEKKEKRLVQEEDLLKTLARYSKLLPAIAGKCPLQRLEGTLGSEQ